MCRHGYTQEEVDSLVAEAVEGAVAKAKDEFVSQAEAEAQVAAAERQASLAAAVETCLAERTADPHIVVDQGGLFMEGQGDEDAGTSVDRIFCVLTELDVPESTLGRMETTNSPQMGLVEVFWGDYEAQWSYHPDNGFDINVRVMNK